MEIPQPHSNCPSLTSVSFPSSLRSLAVCGLSGQHSWCWESLSPHWLMDESHHLHAGKTVSRLKSSTQFSLSPIFIICHPQIFLVLDFIFLSGLLYLFFYTLNIFHVLSPVSTNAHHADNFNFSPSVSVLLYKININFLLQLPWLRRKVHLAECPSCDKCPFCGAS